MASVINTNIASLNTQRNMSMSQSSLNTSIQRLSSGLRVNSAKDDAAGLAIATRMDSQVRGMNVAIRNSNDAVSFAQTAEGGLSKITDSLQRMRELAVQSKNATNTDTDRANLNTEFAQLAAEITRVAGSTNFNGVNALAGGAKDFQVGTGNAAGDTISVTGTNMVTDATIMAATTGTAQVGTAQVGTAQVGTAQVGTAQVGTAQIGTAGNGIVGDANEFDSADYAAASADYAAGVPSSIATAAGAETAIDAIDAALTTVNTERALYGATQNRFEAVISNLQLASENQSAAKSRIMDADFAAETSNLTRGQILQQAGTAMLAQANSLPNNVLSLLRG
jgi:flagellin